MKQEWQGFYAQLLDLNRQPSSRWPVGKIVCIGRNYAAHAQELNNPIPEQPLIFIKPTTSACQIDTQLNLNSRLGPIHYETEIALLIGATICQASPEEAMSKVIGVGLALDLTLREEQTNLKNLGHPWERSKAWDKSCPVTNFISSQEISDWHNLELCLKINGQVKQLGNTAQMLTSIPNLLSHLSQTFTLLPGDLVITGTPAGVGQLAHADQLELSLTNYFTLSTQVNLS